MDWETSESEHESSISNAWGLSGIWSLLPDDSSKCLKRLKAFKNIGCFVSYKGVTNGNNSTWDEILMEYQKTFVLIKKQKNERT